MRKLARDKSFGERASRLLVRLQDAAGRETLLAWVQRLESPATRGLYSKIRRWQAARCPSRSRTPRRTSPGDASPGEAARSPGVAA